ncbi:hypothetical protein OESDEN_10881, partial [Oesophagostomum dentatum]
LAEFSNIFEPAIVKFIIKHNIFSEFVRGSYNNFSRIGWALSVSWVIIANHLGWGGIIADFMDHPLWQPLGRLSYSGFIVHFWLVRYIFNLDDRPSHFVSIWRTYIHLGIPTTVVSYVFAFFWSGLFEVPIMKLEKLLTGSLLPSRNRQSVKPVCDAKTKLEDEIPSDRSGNVQPKALDVAQTEGASEIIRDNTTAPESVLVTKPHEIIGEGDDGEEKISTKATMRRGSSGGSNNNKL